MLKITHLGNTSFRLESEKMSILLNPGIWENEPVVPDDYDVRVIAITNHFDHAVGNAAVIAANSKSWILGNQATIDRVKEQGGKPWLLHVLHSEVPYEIPGLKISPFSLHKKDLEKNEKVENMGLYIEAGDMRVAYLGDTIVRGIFGQLEIDVLITPIGGDGVFAVKDATSLCIDVQPRVGIPVGWTDPDQAKKFAKYIDQFGSGTVPVIMEAGQTLKTDWAAGNEFRFTLS